MTAEELSKKLIDHIQRNLGEYEKLVNDGADVSQVFQGMNTRLIRNFGDKDLSVRVILFKICERSPLYKKIYNPSLSKAIFVYDKLTKDKKSMLNALLSKRILPVWYKV